MSLQSDDSEEELVTVKSAHDDESTISPGDVELNVATSTDQNSDEKNAKSFSKISAKASRFGFAFSRLSKKRTKKPLPVDSAKLEAVADAPCKVVDSSVDGNKTEETLTMIESSRATSSDRVAEDEVERSTVAFEPGEEGEMTFTVEPAFKTDKVDKDGSALLLENSNSLTQPSDDERVDVISTASEGKNLKSFTDTSEAREPEGKPVGRLENPVTSAQSLDDILDNVVPLDQHAVPAQNFHDPSTEDSSVKDDTVQTEPSTTTANNKKVRSEHRRGRISPLVSVMLSPFRSPRKSEPSHPVSTVKEEANSSMNKSANEKLVVEPIDCVRTLELPGKEPPAILTNEENVESDQAQHSVLIQSSKLSLESRHNVSLENSTHMNDAEVSAETAANVGRESPVGLSKSTHQSKPVLLYSIPRSPTPEPKGSKKQFSFNLPWGTLKATGDKRVKRSVARTSGSSKSSKAQTSRAKVSRNENKSNQSLPTSSISHRHEASGKRSKQVSASAALKDVNPPKQSSKRLKRTEAPTSNSKTSKAQTSRDGKSSQSKSANRQPSLWMGASHRRETGGEQSKQTSASNADANPPTQSDKPLLSHKTETSSSPLGNKEPMKARSSQSTKRGEKQRTRKVAKRRSTQPPAKSTPKQRSRCDPRTTSGTRQVRSSVPSTFQNRANQVKTGSKRHGTTLESRNESRKKRTPSKRSRKHISERIVVVDQSKPKSEHVKQSRSSASRRPGKKVAKEKRRPERKKSRVTLAETNNIDQEKGLKRANKKQERPRTSEQRRTKIISKPLSVKPAAYTGEATQVESSTGTQGKRNSVSSKQKMPEKEASSSGQTVSHSNLLFSCMVYSKVYVSHLRCLDRVANAVGASKRMTQEGKVARKKIRRGNQAAVRTKSRRKHQFARDDQGQRGCEERCHHELLSRWNKKPMTTA